MNIFWIFFIFSICQYTQRFYSIGQVFILKNGDFLLDQSFRSFLDYAHSCKMSCKSCILLWLQDSSLFFFFNIFGNLYINYLFKCFNLYFLLFDFIFCYENFFMQCQLFICILTYKDVKKIKIAAVGHFEKNSKIFGLFLIFQD